MSFLRLVSTGALSFVKRTHTHVLFLFNWLSGLQLIQVSLGLKSQRENLPVA